MNFSLKMKRSDWRLQNWGFKVNLWFLGFIFVEVLILARKIAFYRLKRLSVWYWKEESLIFQSCKSIMVAQKKPVGRNILHFSTYTNPKSNESMLSTLLILPDHMKDYCKIYKQRALRNYFCRKMISNLASQ